MDNDYNNFVGRMGSFEDSIDLSDDISNNIIEHNDFIVTRNRAVLEHHGILGMKWGRHVNGITVGAAASLGKNSAKLGQEINKGNMNRKVLSSAKSMSDDDLKKLTSRLNLENNYINATNQQSGKGKVDSILATTGTALAVASSAAVLYDVIRKARGK